MTKNKNAALSIEARGKLGKDIIYQKLHKTQTAKSYRKPANPNTENQQAVRVAMQGLISAWQSLTDEQKTAWNSYGQKSRRPGYSEFLRLNYAQFFDSETYDEWPPDHIEPPGPWYNEAWENRIKITVDNSKVSGSADFENIPLFVDLAELPAAFFTAVKADGGDIRVTTGDMVTEMPREVVSLDTGAETGELHFQAPALKYNENTDFYIYYNNPAASDYAPSDPYGAENVWPSTFKGVWHKNDVTTSTIKDSTSNANNGTKKAANEPTEAAGKVGQAQDYDGTNDYIAIPDKSYWSFPGNFTISYWIKWEGTPGATSIMGHDEGGGGSKKWILGWNNTVANKVSIHIQTGGYNISWSWTPSADTWYLMTVKRSSNSWYLYVNGAATNSPQSNSVAFPSISAPLTLGSDGESWKWVKGLLDEIRIQDTAEGADQIITEYNNQADQATFFTIAAPETKP